MKRRIHPTQEGKEQMKREKRNERESNSPKYHFFFPYYFGNIILLLFLDPLSAVDSHVGRKLFGTISGQLRGSTRLLVTHQL